MENFVQLFLARIRALKIICDRFYFQMPDIKLFCIYIIKHVLNTDKLF